jgi:hypothetical protein
VAFAGMLEKLKLLATRYCDDAGALHDAFEPSSAVMFVGDVHAVAPMPALLAPVPGNRLPVLAMVGSSAAPAARS